MSVSLWAYSPAKCDGQPCCGDCCRCSKAEETERCGNCEFWCRHEDSIYGDEGVCTLADNDLQYDTDWCDDWTEKGTVDYPPTEPKGIKRALI